MLRVRMVPRNRQPDRHAAAISGQRRKTQQSAEFAERSGNAPRPGTPADNAARPGTNATPANNVPRPPNASTPANQPARNATPPQPNTPRPAATRTRNNEPATANPPAHNVPRPPTRDNTPNTPNTPNNPDKRPRERRNQRTRIATLSRRRLHAHQPKIRARHSPRTRIATLNRPRCRGQRPRLVRLNLRTRRGTLHRLTNRVLRSHRRMNHVRRLTTTTCRVRPNIRPLRLVLILQPQRKTRKARLPRRTRRTRNLTARNCRWINKAHVKTWAFPSSSDRGFKSSAATIVDIREAGRGPTATISS